MDDASQFASNTAGLRPREIAPKAAAPVAFRAVAKDCTVSLGEQCFAVGVLILSTGAFVNLFPGEQGVEFEEQGLLFAQILWSLLFALLLFIARKQLTHFGRLLWEHKLLVLLLAWAGLSVAWSIDPQVTVRHFVALLATSLFGIYLASRYDLPGQLRLVSISLGIVIGASIAACLAFPRYGIAPADILDEPAWQGVLTHKNTLGRLGVLAALILALYFLRRRRRLTILLGVLSLFLLVILTSSKTALVYFILGAAAFPFIRAFQRNPAQRKKILVLTAAVFGGVVGWVGYNWESFVATLGKDPTLTGRVALWAMSLDWIGEKPFLGYGYDAFWSAYYGPAADIRMAVNWLGAPHAHNGFINLWLDLGLVGVILFSAVFIQTYRLALSRAYASHTTEGIWPIAFLTFMFVYSLTEISFMSRTDLFWILFVSIMFGLRREAVQIRPRQPDPVRTR